MALFMQGRKRRLVVDIGSSCLRICELAKTKAGYQLVKYYQHEYSSDPALEEEKRKDLRVKALTDLVKEAKIRSRKVVFGVPGQSVFTRSRALPPVPEYKVTQIVRYEIQQQIPFSLDQIAMDYQVLDRTEAGGYEVMMAAIKVDVVEKSLVVLQGAKKTIDIVDVSPLAAYNWLKHTGEFGDGTDCVALIDMGATTTDIIIEREGQFRFTRPLNVGGNDVTLAIAAAFGMNFSDAEKIKRERGFAPTGDAKTDGKGGDVIGQSLHRMVSEIMRSFAYFRSLPGGGQVNRVILCGGGACLRNIIPYMQQQLGIEVRIAQPLAGLAVAPSAQQVSEHPEQSCIALGLALRCCQTVPIEINLIPPRVLEAVRRKEQAFYWVLSLATLGLIMASIIPVKANENKNDLQRIALLRDSIKMYDDEVNQRISRENPTPPSTRKQDYEEAKRRVESLKINVDHLDNARRSRTFWIDPLALVNDARPERMWFSSLETSSVSMFVPGAQPVAQPVSYGYDEDEDEEYYGGGYMMNPMMNTAAAMVPGLTAAGFPPVIGGATRGMMMYGGYDDDEEDEDGGYMPSYVMQQQVEDTGPAHKPNGLIIQAFVEDDRQIRTFVDALRKSKRRLPSRKILEVKAVYFSEASVERVPYQTLQYAPTTGSMGMGMGMGSGRASANPYAAYGKQIFSFTVVVEFAWTDARTVAAAPVQDGGIPTL